MNNYKETLLIEEQRVLSKVLGVHDKNLKNRIIRCNIHRYASFPPVSFGSGGFLFRRQLEF